MYISLGGNCSIAYQLQKYGLRKMSLPFDWTNMTITQLINILENDFQEFNELKIVKESVMHPIISQLIASQPLQSSSSLILTNKYKIRFAHEISTESELEILKSKYITRIQRFKQFKNPNFIRIELGKLNIEKYIKELEQLKNILDKYFESWNCHIIVHQDYINDFKITYKEFKISSFTKYSSDWQLNKEYDWNKLFT